MKCGNERNASGKMKTSFTSLMESSAGEHPTCPQQDSLGQIGKQAGAQLQRRFPGDGAILRCSWCSFVFQGQMVFASLTFTADVILHAGLLLAVLFPLFPFILSLPTCVPRTSSSLWQGDNWISQQVQFTESQGNLVPTAEPSALGKHGSGSPEHK